MLSFFSVPKPFRGQINLIQRNAIQSWLALRPKCEIILFGNEEGIAEVAAEFGLLHVSEIERNEFGTPFISSAFNQSYRLANNPFLAYINADIILLSDFISAVQWIKKSSFLMVSQRWNLNLKEEIKFNEADWETKLRNQLTKKGRLFSPSGIEYFVFPRDLQLNLPPFLAGRSGYDNWLLYQARSLKIPVIDATKVVTIIHQHHSFASHDFRGEKGVFKKIETQRNFKLIGSFSHSFTLRDADWILTNQGLKKRRLISPLQYFYRSLGGLLTFYSYFSLRLRILLFPGWLLAKTAEKLRDLFLKRGKFWIK